MRLGTYWLVRIGIVMVLTALVFFGNLAYQNFISKLGPGGKVSLLYLASAALLVAGGWWQRKAAKESLKNYAQVLFAGGLAAVYFTTYAAHHIEISGLSRVPDWMAGCCWRGRASWSGWRTARSPRCWRCSPSGWRITPRSSPGWACSRFIRTWC